MFGEVRSDSHYDAITFKRVSSILQQFPLMIGCVAETDEDTMKFTKDLPHKIIIPFFDRRGDCWSRSEMIKLLAAEGFKRMDRKNPDLFCTERYYYSNLHSERFGN